MSKKKKIYFEILRIISCYWVIFNHTQANGFDMYTQVETQKPVFWVYLAISIMCKMAVPVFFAISGALLLTRQESLKDIYLKRVLRFVITIVLFSFVDYCADIWVGNTKAFNIMDFIRDVYGNRWNYPFWYLYAYLAFLITLPILREIAVNMTNRTFKYLVIIHMVFNCLWPVVQYLIFTDTVESNVHFSFAWIGEYIVFYPLLGYFMEHRFDDEKVDKSLPLLWAANIAGILLSCLATYRKALVMGYMNDEVSETYFMSFVAINCFTMFFSIKWLCRKIAFTETAQKIICSVGSATFGIYLIHIVVMNKNPWFPKFWDFMHTQVRCNFMLTGLIGSLLVMLIAYVIVLLLKLIPGVKKLI